MSRNYSARHYLAFQRDGLHRDHPSPEAWSEYVRSAVKALGMSPQLEYRVVSGPSRRQAYFTLKDNSIAEYCSDPRRLCPIIVDEPPTRDFYTEINQEKHRQTHGLTAIGADLPIHFTDYWSPTESRDPIFGTRRMANELMGVLDDNSAEPGTGANVVIVDQGLNQAYIEHLGGAFMGGWSLARRSRPGKFAVGHVSMLARNLLKVAPDAAIFDLPIVPETIENIAQFVSGVHAALDQVVETIQHLRKGDEEQWQRPWIFVNAWAAYNTTGEQPRGDYTQRVEHQFNQLISAVALEFDMVFAAGNCGQFCPSRLCGPDDVGPGQSIIGANSHPDVLTVGAVRADGVWLGYSSQGPGALCKEKPDICAASQFREDADATTSNTGTSAACAIAAGVVAALRSRFRSMALTPAALKRILIDTATGKPAGAPWDNQLGNGIINAAAACSRVRE